MEIIKQLKVGETFPINEELAGIVPLAVRSEQEALTQSISVNGLNTPVTLYKGKIVDGRCRQIGCTIAGVQVRAVDLDDSLSEEQVKIWVKIANTRRNLSTTQKIMSACKEANQPGSASTENVAKSWGISRAILVRAKYVIKSRPDMFDPLFNGKTVLIEDPTGKAVQTNRVSAIHVYLKREKEAEKGTVDYVWDANDHINTQVGKEWFFKFIKDKVITDVEVMKQLCTLANYEYTSKEK